MDDKDRIIDKNTTTNSYVNGNGEHLKFTDKSMSIYSNDPREPHEGIHINLNHDKGTFTVTSHNEDRTEKSSNTGNCFLTSACMKFFQEQFDDNCYELTVLRWFRDKFVSKEDVEHYYEVAPIIVEAIENDDKKELIYDYIYKNVISYCVKEIEKENYDSAYSRYKCSVQTFENIFVKQYLGKRLIKIFQKN